MASRYERQCSAQIKDHWDKNLANADAFTLKRLLCGMKQRAVEQEGFWTKDRKWLQEQALWRLEQLKSIGMAGKRAGSGWDPVEAMEKQASTADQRAKLNARWEEMKDAEAPRFEPKWHQKWARHRIEIERKHGCSLRKDISRGDWL